MADVERVPEPTNVDITDDIALWLRIWLDEDERVAREATAGTWTVDTCSVITDDVTGDNRSHVLYSVGMHNRGWPSSADAEHIARHDPARVLREVAAKRRVLERHQPVHAWDGKLCCDWCSVLSVSVYQEWPCPDVRDAAAPYEDRPGYREEWRPV
jgi:hypothetical protein